MRISSVNRLIVYVLCVTTLVNSCSVVAMAKTSAELQQEKDELERQKKEAEAEKSKAQADLDAANANVSSIAGEINGVQSDIDATNRELVETLAAIDMIHEEIDVVKVKIDKTTKEYDAAKAEEDKQYNAMKLRIKYMYEKGNTTYMQLLIESQGFADMMNKAEYIEKLYEYDRKLLLEYIDAKEEAAAIKDVLEEQKSELEGSEFELTEEEDYLNGILDELKEQYDEIDAVYQQAKSEASVFKAKVANQNNAIKNLEKQSASKDKEIETARAKEEEERRAAEEAARAAANASNSTSTSTNNVTTSQTSSSAGGSYKSPSEFSGSTGEVIIQYAKQFVGNPYVYGGTSLTQGCDCSGFVWRVYKDCGISIPRVGQRSIGTEVSYENARAGDIICYAGHVALYCGDGTIVHASTARTGIKIGNANYKNWITIRRVV